MKFRPRYSLRVLLIVVTIVAIGCWSYRVFERQREFAGRATRFNALADVYKNWPYFVTPEVQREYEPKFREAEAYYRQLAEKYRQAADDPWWPLAADPAPSENVQAATEISQRFY